MCGDIVRAKGPDEITEGIWSSYIVYSYSACAMLIMWHYFADMPFKRLETLHAGWGIPLPDANQYNIVSECDNYLTPLCNVLEKFGMMMALRVRLDDTGSMVISLRREIKADIADLKSKGALISFAPSAATPLCFIRPSSISLA